MATDRKSQSNRSGGCLLAVTIGWAALFSYLLLASSPPEIGRVRLRSFEDPGHLVGSLLLAFLVFLTLARRLKPGSTVVVSLGSTLAFLLLLELVQELIPGRSYQQIDIELTIAGAALGIALAWAFSWLRLRRAGRGGPSGPA